MLAAAASAASAAKGATPPATKHPAANSLLTDGPFNPAAFLPPKVVKKILELEFVEMSEISVNDEPPQAPGRPPAPAHPPVQDISQWVERFSLFAAILGESPRTMGLSGNNRASGAELRGEAVGHLQPPIPVASTGEEGPQLVGNGPSAIQRSLHRPGSLNCPVHLLLTG
jgi:hypothetical protein